MYHRRVPSMEAAAVTEMPIEPKQGPLIVAVVGATGLVGRTMIGVLQERGFPVAELRPLASRSDGRSVEMGGRAWPVAVAEPDAFAGVDIALFSAGGGTSARLAPEAAARGAVVVDNSSQWRMDPGVPLVVVGVNDEDAAAHEGIVANPNCSTMQLMPLLRALQDAVGLERVIVDTYQAVSGTGNKAVAELQDQVEAHAAGREPLASVYPHQIAFNALPHIDVFLDNGYTKEEWKVVTETRKILHLPDLPVSCTAVRVPVFASHSEAVHAELSRPLDPGAARELFASIPGVIVQDDPARNEYPLAIHAAGRDEVFVGRVRQDASLPDGRGLAFWVVSDNLRKGAATNAVEIAEVLVRNDWLAPASRRAVGVA
jgi:aspartate-semialdehyde dehydrogenase